MLANLVKRLTPRARLLVIANLLVVAWGCGSYHPLRPTAMTPEILPPPPAPALLGGLVDKVGGLVSDAPIVGTVVEVIDDTVTPTAEKALSGGRYELVFPVGAVAQTTNVTLTQPDSARILFELEPHGTQFGTPVVLTIDYTGTNADPDSPSYDGSMPVLFWYNDRTGAWEVVPGVSDVGEKRHIVQLHHFSTYSLSGQRGELGGKGGW